MSLLDQLLTFTSTSFVQPGSNTRHSSLNKNKSQYSNSSQLSLNDILKKDPILPQQKKQRLLLRLAHMIKNKTRKKYLQFWVNFDSFQKKIVEKGKDNHTHIKQGVQKLVDFQETYVSKHLQRFGKTQGMIAFKKNNKRVMGCEIVSKIIKARFKSSISDFFKFFKYLNTLELKLDLMVSALNTKTKKQNLIFGFQRIKDLSLKPHVNTERQDSNQTISQNKNIIIQINCPAIKFNKKFENSFTLEENLTQHHPPMVSKLHVQKMMDDVVDIVDSSNLFLPKDESRRRKSFSFNSPISTPTNIQISIAPNEVERTEKKMKKLSVMSNSTIFQQTVQSKKQPNIMNQRPSLKGTQKTVLQNDRRVLANIMSSLKNSPIKTFSKKNQEASGWKRHHQSTANQQFLVKMQNTEHSIASCWYPQEQIQKFQGNRNVNMSKKCEERSNKIIISLKNKRKSSQIEDIKCLELEKRHDWRALYEKRKKEKQRRQLYN